MTENIILCKGCGHPLTQEDIELWKRPESGGIEDCLCCMCQALGTPEEFLDTLLSPEEKDMYNRNIKGYSNKLH